MVTTKRTVADLLAKAHETMTDEGGFDFPNRDDDSPASSYDAMVLTRTANRVRAWNDQRTIITHYMAGWWWLAMTVSFVVVLLKGTHSIDGMGAIVCGTITTLDLVFEITRRGLDIHRTYVLVRKMEDALEHVGIDSV